MSISKITLYILLSASLLFSCKKQDEEEIPYAPVSIVLYTNDPLLNKVATPGTWTYISGGVKGILLYRKSMGEFIAYERNSPYQPSKGCAVEVDNSNILVEDKCSGSKFLITDGSVSNGPATKGLKLYNTSFDGTVLNI